MYLWNRVTIVFHYLGEKACCFGLNLLSSPSLFLEITQDCIRELMTPKSNFCKHPASSLSFSGCNPTSSSFQAPFIHVFIFITFINETQEGDGKIENGLWGRENKLRKGVWYNTTSHILGIVNHSKMNSYLNVNLSVLTWEINNHQS